MWELVLGVVLSINAVAAPERTVKTWGMTTECNQRSWWPSAGLPYLIISDQEVWLGLWGESMFHKLQLVAKTGEEGGLEHVCGKDPWRAKIMRTKDGSILLTSSDGWIHFVPTTDPNVYEPTHIGPRS